MTNTKLLSEIRECTLCSDNLALEPRPILQAHKSSRILIAGQAPGRITHEKGIPFDDPSGNRLRDWMGVSRAEFYDETKFAIVPMSFCFPGSGKGGDLPPIAACAAQWRVPLLSHLENVRLTLVIGQYAMKWHLKPLLKTSAKVNLTQIVTDWQSFMPLQIPLPHPSPRNNIWLKKNPWFAEELLPILKQSVRDALLA